MYSRNSKKLAYPFILFLTWLSQLNPVNIDNITPKESISVKSIFVQFYAEYVS